MKITTVMDESGTTRMPNASVTIKTDRLEIVIDTDSLAQSLANFGASQVTEAIRNSGEQASKSTIRQRREKGISSDRVFYATGRLANGIEAVRTSDTTYDVVAPPGYLQSDEIMERFADLILEKMFAGSFDIKVQNQVEKIADGVAKVRK